MQSEVQLAGFGGQGIMLMGQILAEAAMQEGHEVVWIPSYGPDMRGGTAYCTVVISDRPVGSPIIRNPRHLVAMNRPSLENFAPTVKKGGVAFINSSIIPGEVRWFVFNSGDCQCHRAGEGTAALAEAPLRSRCKNNQGNKKGGA